MRIILRILAAFLGAVAASHLAHSQQQEIEAYVYGQSQATQPYSSGLLIPAIPNPNRFSLLSIPANAFLYTSGVPNAPFLSGSGGGFQGLTGSAATALLSPCTSTVQGVVPTPPNDATKFLNGKCSFASSGSVSPDVMGAPHNGTSDDSSGFSAALATGIPVQMVCNGTPYKLTSNVIIATPAHLMGCGTILGSPINLSGASAGITITSSGVIVENVHEVGDRTTGQVGIKLTGGSRDLVRNVQVELADICFQQGVGAGVINNWEHIYGRNCKSIFATFQDGIGPIIDEALYDTDVGSYADPQGIVVETEGVFMTRADILDTTYPLIIQCNGAHHANGPIWGEYGLNFFDISQQGVLITNQSGGGCSVRGEHFHGTWFATSTNNGLTVTTDSLSSIQTVLCDGCQIHNNGAHGVSLSGNSNDIIFNGSIISGNGSASGSAYDNVKIATTAPLDTIVFNGGIIGRAEGETALPKYNLEITTPSYVRITGTYFDVGGVTTANIVNPGGANIQTDGLSGFETTASTLGPCTTGNAGNRTSISDATSGTFGAPVGSGGSHHVLAYCDVSVSGWVVH
jgi:hypothetical protein